MWENILDEERPQTTIQYGACALHAVQLGLDTRTFMYVILIAFQQQKRLREGVSVLCDTYIVHCV